MDRTFESGAAGSPPSAPASPSTGYPTAGNPSLAVPATKPGPWWYHMMTEELRAVIVAAGLTPDHTDVTQLTQAIQALFVANQKAVVINNATFEASVSNGEVVRWDSGNSRFDEAVADGTSNNRAVGIADVTNSKVYLYGECPLFSGLTPGARYYLDASTPGAITTTAPTGAVMVGIAKSATTLWVDVDAMPVVRTRLTGNLTVYVATTGNDNNTGLSAGSPFLTLNKAYNFIRDNYDLNGYTATIQLVDGTYTTGLVALRPALDSGASGGAIVVSGNTGTPANVLINVPGGTAITASSGARLMLQGLKMQGGYAITCGNSAEVSFSNVDFGACSVAHCYAGAFGIISASGNYTISGGSTSHFWSVNSGYIEANSRTITLTGTPAFSNAFAIGSMLGLVLSGGCTFSGSATGARYSASGNGVINTAGAGANYFPGSVAGSTATGGQYV